MNNLEFTVLLKDTSSCGKEELGIEPLWLHDCFNKFFTVAKHKEKGVRIGLLYVREAMKYVLKALQPCSTAECALRRFDNCN